MAKRADQSTLFHRFQRSDFHAEDFGRKGTETQDHRGRAVSDLRMPAMAPGVLVLRSLILM
jgi:hypothetical protein